MAAAANYGRANRHVLAHEAREIFARTAGARLDLVYDVSHNLAKMETHEVDGEPTLVCVHRKGATRALPPGHPDLPADLREAGQPVLIPGSGLAEETPEAYKDVNAVVEAAEGAGLCRKVARLVPLGVVKG
jgi:tRNA-splicing ligase RtcB (3'-phosphate/5'-hydroxy nucleic acid ligase)